MYHSSEDDMMRNSITFLYCAFFGGHSQTLPVFYLSFSRWWRFCLLLRSRIGVFRRVVCVSGGAPPSFFLIFLFCLYLFEIACVAIRSPFHCVLVCKLRGGPRCDVVYFARINFLLDLPKTKKGRLV